MSQRVKIGSGVRLKPGGGEGEEYPFVAILRGLNCTRDKYAVVGDAKDTVLNLIYLFCFQMPVILSTKWPCSFAPILSTKELSIRVRF